jgi:UDP-N-acetyl-D-galactosamine dehydrogenase
LTTSDHGRGADTVCIVGLGYVGLPLAVEFDRAGLHVIGYDVDADKVAALAEGDDPTNEVGAESIRNGDVQFTAEPDAISDADYVILTVPTPVDDLGNPDLSFIESAGETVGQHMSRDTTVVLESTVFPGATETVLVPAIEDASGLSVGEDFEVGYSPERASPGDTGRSVTDVVKIVSGRTDAVTEDLAELYGVVVDAGTYEAPTIQTAEAAKAIENVQRDINIALVNELAIACDYMDLNTHEVLEAAGTKWNFHDGYRPGLVGGHCIPVDPLFLAHRSEREGFSPKLILQGREINEYMPTHTANLTVRALNQGGKVLKDSKLLVMGLAYKPNVPDIRTSEINGVISELQTYDVELAGHDPHADDDAMREEFGIEIQEELSFEGFDGVILAAAHDEYLEVDFEDAFSTLEETAAENGYIYRQL